MILVSKTSLALVPLHSHARWLGWMMWFLVATFYCYQFFIRVSPTVMANELMQAFTVTAGGLGVLTSSYFLVYAPLQLPLGIIVDKIGPRRLAAGSVCFCAIGCLVFSCAPNLVVAQVGRMLMGAGSAGAFLSCLKVATVWLPPQRLSLVGGLTMMIGTIGATSASRPLALLIQNVGWREALMGFSILGFAIALLILFVVKDRPQVRATQQDIATAPPPTEGLLAGLKIVAGNPQCWLIAIFTFLMYAPMCVFGDMWGVPYFMQRFCVDCVSAAAPASMLYVGLAVGAPLMSWFSDAVKSRRIPLFMTTLSTLVLFSLLFYGPEMSITMASVVVFATGVMLGGQMLAFTIICEMNKIRLSGTAIGFNNSICMLSGVLFQPYVGWVLDWMWGGSSTDGIREYSTLSYNWSLGVIPACAILATLLVLFLKETYHLMDDEGRKH